MAKKQNNRKRKKHRALWLFIKIQIVLILLVIGGLVYYYAGGYAKKISALHDEAVELVAESDENTFKRNQTSIAYDVNGNTLSIMKGERDTYYLPYDEIPENAKLAAVSIEDKKFYRHKGVDYKAIIRAVWAMIRNRSITQGASTITQQLARNVFLNQDKTWERKIEEIYISVELEKKYSKNQILEFYLNNINFANGYYGIEAASVGYFGCGVEDLSLSKICFLIAIPNRPESMNPRRFIENTISRRDRILKNMYMDGVIKENEYIAAKNEKIELQKSSRVYNNYMETYMRVCATKALMEVDGFKFKTTFKSDDERERYDEEYKEKYEECNKKLYTGGYRIYTSYDINIQNALQSNIDSCLSNNTETNAEGVYSLQGAAVCIDNTTGAVKAIVGGRSQDIEGYTLNRAYQSFRQPGSSIKPLLVYSPALERGMTADTEVVDEEIPNGPKNADDSYLGRISLRKAVEDSRNTVAWKIFEQIGPHVAMQYLYNLGFEKITSADEIPAASIGGLTHGVSPLEMARGYATLVNDGRMRDSTCVLKITDASGKVLYQTKQEETEIYHTDAARNMTNILQGVMTEGTAKGNALENMPCAGKTGTTNDNKDGWFVGYTRYYTTSVWVGYDQPKELKGLRGDAYPLHIWHDFMSEIHKDLVPLDFVPSQNNSEEPTESKETTESNETTEGEETP
ncbi:MAG: PBP1A family penicillin-binding protein [Lachnospiraceae bacterium]|nr:PBP1A family penicillin-binding protein [Lachnospiraceae bacterium]